MSRERPAVTVLEGEFRVVGLGRIADRADLRIVSSTELPAAIPDTEILLLWDFFSDAVAEIWPLGKRLKWVHIAAAGVDKLLVPALTESAVVVTNAQGVFDVPMAEYVLTCVAAHRKLLPETIELQRQGKWVTRETRNLAGSSALVVGAGGIGRATARLLRAVGIEVTLVGRSPRQDAEFGQIKGSADLRSIVGGFDTIVAALPLTAETDGLISRKVIAAMRTDALVVNVGRGRTIDEAALTAALVEDRIGGAALDVFEAEPLPHTSPLWRLPNVLVSPHTSSRTTGWHQVLADQFCDNFDAWVVDAPMSGVVDKRLGFVANLGR